MADDVATVGGFFSDVGDARQFRTLVNAIDDGLYQLDPRGHFVAVNDVIAEVTGYDRERLLGEHVSLVLDETDVERIETAIRGLLGSDPDTATLELTVETADGEEIPCELRVNLLVQGGEFQGTVGVVRDVSDRRARERELAAAEQRFRSLVDAVEEYAIFMLDPEGCVVSWNAGARRLKGYDRKAIVGEHFSTFYTERDREAGVPETNLAAAREEGSTEDEGWRVRADGSRFWANSTIRPLRDDDGSLQGYAKVVRDMTERKRTELERELLYETTRSVAEAETFADGLEAALRRICAATDWEFAEAWIPAGEGVLRRASAEYYESDLEPFASFSKSVTFDRGEGLPGRVWASGDYEWADDLASGSLDRYPRIERARDLGMQSALGVPVTADDEVVAVLTFATRELREPDERAVDLVSSVAAKLGNLLRRRQAEQAHWREQELTERVLQTSPVGIAVFSADGTVKRLNDRMNEVLQLSGESLQALEPGSLDLRDSDGNPIPVEDRPVERAFRTGQPVIGQEVQIETDDGRRRWLSVNATPVTEGSDPDRVVATATDVTRLKAQARRLQRQRDDLETELDEMFERIDDAFVALDDDLRFTYVNEQAKRLLGRDGERLLGERAGDAFPGATEFREHCLRAMETQEQTTFEAYVESLTFWAEASVYPSESGVSVYFRDVTDRKGRERELEHQRERLAALNSLHEVVQDVTDAVVEQSTREEIEEIVCERLADSESYRFAWIGDVDPRTETVRLRTEAGVEGYLDGVTISTDPEDERSYGPTGRAIRTGEIQTTQDIESDPRHDPWREHCEAYGFRSSAAIPIVHDGTTYGVLSVYADRPAAFTDEERAVIGQLGEVVGHAIAAVERKRALLSDEVVELDLHVEDVLAELDPNDLPTEKIDIDQVVPVGDDEYLTYGTVDEADVDTLHRLVEVLDHWRSVRIVREGRDRTTFELRAVEPPLATIIAARGGCLEEAYVDGRDFFMTVQLPPDVDPRGLLDAARERYPGVSVLAQRQVTRTDDGPTRVAAAFEEALTDRQRAAIETAYFAGYFDWPRESSGEEVASSLDVSAATFSQHLRTAERRIFEALFEED